MSERKTEFRVNEEGEIEEYDKETGEIVAKAPSMDALVTQEHKVAAHLFDQRYVRKYKYNQAVADVIIQKMIEGMSLASICKLDGMPTYSIVVLWRKQHEEFDKMIKDMRKYRAEVFRDLIADSMADIPEKEEVPALKLQFEKAKWLAKVDDPDTYSDKSQQGTEQAPVKIVIETGVPDTIEIEDAQIVEQGDNNGPKQNN